MRKTIAVFSLILISCGTSAHARDCNSQERDDGNNQLTAIESDEGRRLSILTEHLPFGVHESTQGQNDQLLYQDGYMLAHDPDLRTVVWVSYRLDWDDIEGASGQERVECFRLDPRLDTDVAARPVDYDEPTFDQAT